MLPDIFIAAASDTEPMVGRTERWMMSGHRVSGALQHFFGECNERMDEHVDARDDGPARGREISV
jgi:hypothetical protein